MSSNLKIKAVFTIIESNSLDKPLFRRIGTAFVNRDGSLNVHLDAFPVNGKLHIRDIDTSSSPNKEPSQEKENKV